ncbi:MAG: Redoxin domain protein, partial [Myxococcaceae bacterium]|nr:Redoxin domain protein [Myxococcaceae bacterium]
LSGVACDRARVESDMPAPAPKTSRAEPRAERPVAVDAGPELDVGAHEIDPRGEGLGRLIDDVAFTDLAGKRGRLSSFKGKTLVVLSWSSTCPVSSKQLPMLKQLTQAIAAMPDTAVLVVLPEPTEDAAKVRASHDLDELAGRIVVGRDISRALDAKTATEAFVLDAARTLRYRGAIDDQYGIGVALAAPRNNFLKDALASVRAGERPLVEATSPAGCTLNPVTPAPVATKTAPTWNREVSRIVQDRCQSCHRTGQAAPFPLLTYADVKGHASMIALVVDSRVMPPWYSHRGVGTWKNDRSLTEAQRSTLLAWVRAGAPEGDPRDAPVPRTFSTDFMIGKPDAIVNVVDPEPVPEAGVLPYRHIVVDGGFAADTWVNRVEIRPAARQVVHHAQVFLLPPLPPGSAPALGALPSTAPLPHDLDAVLDARKIIGSLVPGGESETFAADEGRLVPKGARLLLRVHYQPNGRPVPASAFQIGFVFNRSRPEHELSAACATVQDLVLQPGAKGVEVSARTRLAKRTRVVRFVPHMHFRGKAMRYTATYPDGTSKLLFDGDYDFRWQLWYEPASPLELPAGTRIEVTGTYDNSAGNPQNPDPKATVRYGGQSTDEMMDGCMVVTEDP